MGNEERGSSCEKWTRRWQYVPRRKISQFGLLVFICLNYAHALFRILPRHQKLHPIGLSVFLYSLYLRYLVYGAEQLRKYDELMDRMMDKDEVVRCGRCDGWKVGRTRHCSRCKRCIPRLSHHCGILSVCIGVHNYKPFVQLILVGGISSLLQAWLLWAWSHATALKVIHGEERLSLSMVVRLQANYVLFCQGLILCLFWSYHLLLTWRGWTVAEACKTLSAGDGCPPWRLPRGAYDRGGVRNLQEAFGRGGRMLLPTVDMERWAAAAAAAGEWSSCPAGGGGSALRARAELWSIAAVSADAMAAARARA